MAESLEKLQKEVFIKLACLDNCQGGFETMTYIKLRANAEVDFRPAGKQKLSPQIPRSKNIPHPELYAELKQWRDNLADEKNIPAYMILPQKSILEIMKKLPTTLSGLKKIKGIGQVKVNQFGSDVIAMIKNYCVDHEISPE